MNLFERKSRRRSCKNDTSKKRWRVPAYRHRSVYGTIASVCPKNVSKMSTVLYGNFIAISGDLLPKLSCLNPTAVSEVDVTSRNWRK